MRLSISLDEETHGLVKEMAQMQSRTITSQIAHLIKTNNELVGWRTFKAHPGFGKAQEGPVKLAP